MYDNLVMYGKGDVFSNIDDNLGMYGNRDVFSTFDYNLVIYGKGVCSQTWMIIRGCMVKVMCTQRC